MICFWYCLRRWQREFYSTLQKLTRLERSHDLPSWEQSQGNVASGTGHLSFWRWTWPDWLYRGSGARGLLSCPMYGSNLVPWVVFGSPGLWIGPVFGDSRLHLPLPVLAALSSAGGGGLLRARINILTELSICHFRESFTA